MYFNTKIYFIEKVLTVFNFDLDFEERYLQKKNKLYKLIKKSTLLIVFCSGN